MGKKIYNDYVTTTAANWTAKQMCEYADQGLIKFDNAIQRSLVWSRKQNSLLIHSLIVNFMPPEFLANKSHGIYDMIDGKQRHHAISSFLKDDYALVDVPNIVSTDGEEYILNGKRFSTLSGEIQDKITGRSLKVSVMDNACAEIIKEYFYRRNNGTPLSPTRKTFSKAVAFNEIIEISKHPIFAAMLKNGGSDDVSKGIVMKSYVILFGDNKSLENKKVFQYIGRMPFSPENIEIIVKAYDTLLSVFQELTETRTSRAHLVLKRIKTKTHMITLVPIANYVNSHNIDVHTFTEWTMRFYGEKDRTTISNVYNESTSTGSSKIGAVTGRLNAAMSDIQQFMQSPEND